MSIREKPTEDMIRAGGVVWKRRMALGLSRREVARRVGCVEHTLMTIEQGKREPGVFLALAIEEVLGVYPWSVRD